MSWASVLGFILFIYIVTTGFWYLIGEPPQDKVGTHILVGTVFATFSFLLVASIYLNFVNVLQSGGAVPALNCSDSSKCVMGWTELAGTGLLVALMYWQCYIAGTTMYSVYHNS